MITRLVAHDTTSRNSNLELMAFIVEYLKDLGVESELVHNDEGTKANLYATLGPKDRAGIALSGHTDVVPVDGQDWHTDPFQVVEKEDRLYGRGTSDMKSFIGICLALAPEFLARDIATPLHFAFSYDEEIGCVGVRGLIDALARRPLKPSAVIIGEPTEMKVVRAHKGKLSYRCQVRGHEAHSSLAHAGVNAVEAAAEAVAYLKTMARRHRDHGPFDAEYTPPYTTVHTGTIHGGTALNIVPLDCSFEFEFRHVAEDDPHALLDELRDHIATRIEPEMHATRPETGFHFEPMSHIPALDTDEEADIVQLAKALSGQNTTGKVAFGTEGGLFQNGVIANDQIARCEAFLRKLFERCWQGSV
jgi:acetylornithine deacetylase